MKKVNLFLVSLATLVAMGGVVISCGSSRPSVEDKATEVSIPLSGKEYHSNKDNFRAVQSGISPDLATAKKIALANARAELASNINSVVKAVTENYTNQRTVGDTQEFENKFEENTRVVVNQILSDVRIFDEKVFKERSGKYTYYIAIEKSQKSVLDGITDRISNDDKLKLDFDKFQFQKVFNEEMEKFEKE